MTCFGCPACVLGGKSAELDVRSSRVQLDNLSQILKAKPSVKLQIAADAERQSSSQERARAVVQALVQMGVAPARLRAMSPPLPTADPTGHDGCVAVRVVAR
jgi:outer membrane protein OmpA-like peptidoglycan-associated protein